MTINEPHGFKTSLPCTISTAAKPISHADFGFSAAELAAAEGALITCTADVLFTEDGLTTPVIATSLGHPLPANVLMFLKGGQRVRQLSFIRKTADAIVVITLEKF
jgi:hypothetical protein